ncbi:hypothetical protein K466DRAFT_583233 [Polyporus arcularius HHB13444]|uniref:Uncharacterized protein n=1 Tax=Polyporus arcularius HHB13444 TaxID=1314778 RepID=A0A5C3PT51_9APHY|nr:hypothetical protein K466DRAFT_583233 [Polyporus arcularius HHB13444]
MKQQGRPHSQCATRIAATIPKQYEKRAPTNRCSPASLTTARAPQVSVLPYWSSVVVAVGAIIAVLPKTLLTGPKIMAEIAIMRDIPAAPLDEARDEEIGTLQGSTAYDIPAAPLDEPADEEIEWVDVKSENGVAFKYGVKKSDLEQPEDAPRAAFANRPTPGRPTPRAQLRVDWRVQGDNNWRATAGDFAHHMHISHYILRKTSNIFDWYSYQLDIYTTGGWTFWFHDRSGDKYEILAIRNGRHYVKYNSRDPDIIRVSRP